MNDPSVECKSLHRIMYHVSNVSHETCHVTWWRILCRSQPLVRANPPPHHKCSVKLTLIWKSGLNVSVIWMHQLSHQTWYRLNSPSKQHILIYYCLFSDIQINNNQSLSSNLKSLDNLFNKFRLINRIVNTTFNWRFLTG